MTYRITLDGEPFAEDIEVEAALVSFVMQYRNAMVDGVHVTADGDLLIRLGGGYKVHKDAPNVVRLPHRGRVNAEDKPA